MGGDNAGAFWGRKRVQKSKQASLFCSLSLSYQIDCLHLCQTPPSSYLLVRDSSGLETQTRSSDKGAGAGALPSWRGSSPPS